MPMSISLLLLEGVIYHGAYRIYPSLTPKPRQRRTSLSDLRYDNVDAASQIPGAAKTPESVRYPGAKKASSFPEIHLGPIRS